MIESIQNTSVIMAPWFITLGMVWFVTNTSRPGESMVSLKCSIYLIIVGLMLFVAGILIKELDLFAIEATGQVLRFLHYQFLGLFLVVYGGYGKKYVLSESEH